MQPMPHLYSWLILSPLFPLSFLRHLAASQQGVDTVQQVLLSIGNAFCEAVLVKRVTRSPKLSIRLCTQQIFRLKVNVCYFRGIDMLLLDVSVIKIVLHFLFNFILVRPIKARMYIF